MTTSWFERGETRASGALVDERSALECTRQFEQAFGLKSTNITRRRLRSIKSHKPSQYPSIHNEIEQLERAKFMSLMERLGYRE